MTPGRDLDALVAEHVMGLRPGVDFGEWPEHDWKRDKNGEVDTCAWDANDHSGPACARCHYTYCEHCGETDPEPCEKTPRPYSTDIAAALQVVERMMRRGYHWRGGSTGIPPHGSWFYFASEGTPAVDDPYTWVEERAQANTLPEAICLAALRVMGI